MKSNENVNSPLHIAKEAASAFLALVVGLSIILVTVGIALALAVGIFVQIVGVFV